MGRIRSCLPETGSSRMIPASVHSSYAASSGSSEAYPGWEQRPSSSTSSSQGGVAGRSPSRAASGWSESSIIFDSHGYEIRRGQGEGRQPSRYLDQRSEEGRVGEERGSRGARVTRKTN